MSRPAGHVVPALIVCFGLTAAAAGAWCNGWTYDERFHLGWSQRLLETGQTERASADRFDSKTPVLIPNVLSRRAAFALGWRDERVLRFAARLPGLLWFGALLATVFVVTSRWVDRQAASMATMAVALEPNLIAHSGLATVDALYAFAALLFLATAVAWAQQPSLRRASIAGAALGFAFATKFTAVLLLPALLLLPLVPAEDPAPRLARAWMREAALFAFVAWLMLSAWYLFQGMCVPLAAEPWRSSVFQRAAVFVPRFRVPLPVAFLTGLDSSLAAERGRDWNVYLLGRRYPHGVWYYFIVIWLLKTPLALLAAEAGGLVAFLRWRLWSSPPLRFLTLNLLLWLAYFSFVFQCQKGYRFVLMAVPVAVILASAGWVRWRPRRIGRVASMALALTVMENVFYFGNPLAFTNAAVRPKRQVFRLMADSNVDWGQNREKIAEWLSRGPLSDSRLDPVHLLPGHSVFDLNTLAGIWDFEQHRWLRENAQPQGHLGHTYVWFDVSDELFDRFLEEQRRLNPDAFSQEVCPSDLPLTPAPPGSATPLSLERAPSPGSVLFVCVQTRKGADVALRLSEGQIDFGHVGLDGRFRAERLQAGQVAWYRLAPGSHVLLAREIPNRRAWLPYAVRGVWLVRGHAAALNVREGRQSDLAVDWGTP